ncbi:MAG TPA: DUF1080 domain-containing protein [Candidatus Saccharimonadales bacterium]|nr:DUF1080 domain-containing protein [Candidatus Saccharimonadales bacterium]
MKQSITLALFVTALSLGQSAQSADSHGNVGYTDTPMLPGNKWHVHDPDRPQPRVVTPGTFSTQAEPGKPPSDALVLFDGKDLSKWKNDKGETPKWKIEKGAAIVGGGEITTRDEFTNFQLHVEFATPKPAKGDSQGRGNSGVFLIGLYEFQVLDSYQNRTYADGGAGSMYGQYPPLVNASRPPGEWQVYDIIFTAPHFKDGKLETPAYVTAFHNGVLVQNHHAYLGPTNHRTLATETPHAEKGPIRLQDHGDHVRYRNLWIRPIQIPTDP